MIIKINQKNLHVLFLLEGKRRRKSTYCGLQDYLYVMCEYQRLYVDIINLNEHPIQTKVLAL